MLSNTNSFICTQLNGSKDFYTILLSQFDINRFNGFKKSKLLNFLYDV